jgi:hypothetical protein
MMRDSSIHGAQEMPRAFGPSCRAHPMTDQK